MTPLTRVTHRAAGRIAASGYRDTAAAMILDDFNRAECLPLADTAQVWCDGCGTRLTDDLVARPCPMGCEVAV